MFDIESASEAKKCNCSYIWMIQTDLTTKTSQFVVFLFCLFLRFSQKQNVINKYDSFTQKNKNIVFSRSFLLFALKARETSQKGHKSSDKLKLFLSFLFFVGYKVIIWAALPHLKSILQNVFLFVDTYLSFFANKLDHCKWCKFLSRVPKLSRLVPCLA